MAEYIDSYYLVNQREVNHIKSFLETYMPSNVETVDEYPIPLFASNPIVSFQNVNDILNYLQNNPYVEYSIYWQNSLQNSFIKHCMVFHTNDRKMIFGLSISGNRFDDVESVNLFKNVMSYLKSEAGCITIEEPPPSNSEEFLTFCKSRYIPFW